MSPLRWQRPGSMNQSTALRILSAYLPSLMVLPSMSRTIPPSAVMVVGYWPPLASQCPSRCWFLATHLRPLSIASLYLGSSSSARKDWVARRIPAAGSMNQREALMDSSLFLFNNRAAVDNLFRFIAEIGRFRFRASTGAGCTTIVPVQQLMDNLQIMADQLHR